MEDARSRSTHREDAATADVAVTSGRIARPLQGQRSGAESPKPPQQYMQGDQAGAFPDNDADDDLMGADDSHDGASLPGAVPGAVEENHEHMVDVETGKVLEFQDAELIERLNNIAKDAGYQLVDHNLVLHVKKL